jgi:hypothetical protein
VPEVQATQLLGPVHASAVSAPFGTPQGRHPAGPATVNAAVNKP